MAEELGTGYVAIYAKTQKDFFGGIEKQGKSAGMVIGGKILKGIAALELGKQVVGLITDSVKKYADYEQLVGGIDTLFKESSAAVQQNAQNAFKTAGMSANDYMENVTSFSASLLQSLGGDTAKAAKIADMAMVDMSDNANKMGTDMSSIVMAYQGMAKGQFQLLDNLKLGYGGTKGEAERLLADAEKISGQKYSLDSLSDLYQAIHVIQQELDITGTTSEEAATTISGSANMMAASWDNLLVALADPDADVDQYVNTFVDNLANTLALALPRVGQVALSLLGIIAHGIEDSINGAFAMAGDWILSVGGEWGSYFEQVGNDALDYLGETFGKAPDRVKAGLDGLIKAAKNCVKNLIKAFQKNIKFPDIKLPHLKLDGGSAPFGFGGKGKMPSISIDWYAQGGIITRAAMLGEQGAEAIVPYTNSNIKPWARAMVNAMGGESGNTYVIEGKRIREGEEAAQMFASLLATTKRTRRANGYGY